MDDKLLRMGAVGEEDAILAFKAIGAQVMPATTPDQVASALHRLTREGIPLVFITEAAARMAQEAVSRYEQALETAVIPIPGIRGSDGYGAAKLRETLIKAIGADILNKQD
ncbi:MAG: hypothetical protein GXY84_08465 [Clostridiales bacterium]|nr:hypothetical protein [Clostridiales bacterium]